MGRAIYSGPGASGSFSDVYYAGAGDPENGVLSPGVMQKDIVVLWRKGHFRLENFQMMIFKKQIEYYDNLW